MVRVQVGHAELEGSELRNTWYDDEAVSGYYLLVASDDHFQRARGKGQLTSHRSLPVGLSISLGSYNKISQMS